MKKGARKARGSTSTLNISRKKALPPPLDSLPANRMPETKPGRPCKKNLNVSQRFGISCTGRLQSERPVGTAEDGLKGHDTSLGQRTKLLHPLRLSHKHGSSPQHEQVRSDRHGERLKTPSCGYFWGIFLSDELL